MHRSDFPDSSFSPGGAAAAAFLRAEERRLLACVHCGFCLSACPTYVRLGDEADSPRGRLHLMRGVAEGRLDAASAAFRTHIDRCLGCRACEPVCPSGVEYGFLLERARAAGARAAGQDLRSRLLLRVFANVSWSRAVALPGRLFRATKLATLLAAILPRRFGRLRLALAMLASSRPWRGLRRAGRVRGEPAASRPPSPVPGATRAPATEDIAPGEDREQAAPHGLAGAVPAGTSLGKVEGAGELATERRAAGRRKPKVALLTGCVQQSLYARVNRATRRVLEAHGCEVVEVRAQRCCGALHAHGGELERAHALARANIDAFERADVDHVVVNAAGCGAMMKEYAAQLEHDAAYAARAAAFSERVRDVQEYLVALGVRGGAPLALTVAYDAPCHLHHAQRVTRAPLDVLAAIPELSVVPIAGYEECCGGAGIYGILHPGLGGRILGDKVAAMKEARADVVATPNPGCMMQLGAGLILAGDRTPVVHPIELLAESWRRLEER
jgi:glycolate oxidase iron-sulfur subunit